MPRMRVGALETMGREGETSTPNNEFNPPSCIKINKFNGENPSMNKSTKKYKTIIPSLKKIKGERH